MQRARARGTLLQGEADYQLHILYLWYEKRGRRARSSCSTSLHDRYPGNPLFLAAARRRPGPLPARHHRQPRDLAALLAAARDQRVNEAGARRGAGAARDRAPARGAASDRPRARAAAGGDRARPATPSQALAAAYLALGEARIGWAITTPRVAAYRAAMPPRRRPTRRRSGGAPAARCGARRTRRAEAYRLSLEGLRQLEKTDVAGAEALRSSARSSLNGRIRSRAIATAALLQAQKDDAAALAAVRARDPRARGCPAPIVGAAYLEAARVSRAARRARPGDLTTTAPRPRSSAAPPTRARRDARAHASRSPLTRVTPRVRRCATDRGPRSMPHPRCARGDHDTRAASRDRAHRSPFIGNFIALQFSRLAPTNLSCDFLTFRTTLCLTVRSSHP